MFYFQFFAHHSATWSLLPGGFPNILSYLYRLSRARRVVENAFGLLQSRMRVLGTTLQLKPEVVVKVTMAACVMHNLILERHPAAVSDVDHEDAAHNLVRGAWREDVHPLPGLQHRGVNHPRGAKEMRDYLAQYYSSEAGSVPWQDQMVYPRGRRNVQ